MTDAMKGDTIEVERWRPVHGGDVWVRATDYDALAAELTAARAALVTARNEALEEAAKVAVAYGKVQYSANIERHPQYASDAADDALEIANAIRALATQEKADE